MTIEDDILRDAPPCVAKLCRAMSLRDFDVIEDQLAPDATWTMVGRSDRFQFGGPKSKAEFMGGLRASLPGFDRFSFNVLRWAHNGETVFIEAKAAGVGPGTATYSNTYLIRFIIDNGLIAAALEHYDPFEALAYVEQLSLS